MTADALLSRQVEAMAGYGISARDIATALDIELWMLERDYSKELAGAAIKANSKVAENLYRKATGEGREAVTAAIFWLKARAARRESAVHEMKGADDEPITVVIRRFSDSDLAEPAQQVANLAAPHGE